MVASRSINVKWQHKSQDTSEVTKYILQYKEGEGKEIISTLYNNKEIEHKFVGQVVCGNNKNLLDRLYPTLH